MEDRWNVVVGRKDGMSYAAIEKKYGYTPAFISRWWNRYQETGGVEDAPRSGRPKVLTPTQRREVKKNLKRKTEGSLRRVAKKMKGVEGKAVSKDTIRRAAKEERLNYQRRRKKPLLTERHKEDRLRFARRRRPRGYWERVMFSDETSYALYSLTLGEWVEEGEEPAPQETVKWPPRIRVWAAISSRGKTPLIRIPKKMNSKEFEKLLVEKCIPLMNDIFEDSPDDFVFMQDGDGCHTAKIVTHRLDEEGVEQLLPWPAHSPDLNPAENAWSIVERHLETVRPTTIGGLWKAMKQGWDLIDDDTLLQLCTSMPRRLMEVKEAQGGHTKY